MTACMYYVFSCSGLTKKHIICSTLKIIELFGKVCQVEGCGAEYHLTNGIVGCCMTISARCANGHLRKWSSSERITNSTTGDLFVDNLDFATALVLSGNHFTKFQQFGQFYEMAVLSCSSFYSYQRLYICPVINNFFEKQQVYSKYILHTLQIISFSF